jgi:CNT family concentrative nucleoside transporter
MELYNFISIFGMVCLIFLAWAISANRRVINWHVVVWGIGLQFLFAWFLFIFPAGTAFFLLINKIVIAIMDCSIAGSKFLFGPLALTPGSIGEHGEVSLGFILAFQAFPSIIFFSALMSILYFYNIIPRIIKGFAYLFTKLMKVSGAESLCTASNIFVGIESALTIRPYLKDMTKSELCTVLTAGMATVSSNVLAIYVFSLQNVFPNIAGHLISASVLSAPAALMMSKLLIPEEDIPKTLGENVDVTVDHEKNLFEAIINGANAGARLIVGIVALLMAVVGLVALGDAFITFLGHKINILFHLSFDWSFRHLLGILFYPFTWILGMPAKDVPIISQIIGERVILTEVVSYQDLGKVLAEGLVSPRAAFVATYALCGFAHFASLAIFIGGISAIVPEKTSVLARIGLRALVAATLACLMTACIAGIFFTRESLLLG